jgi:hypothetical protein
MVLKPLLSPESLVLRTGILSAYIPTRTGLAEAETG